METKICSKCNKELPLTDFNWRDKSKGIYRSECKFCHSQYMKDKYQEKKQTVSDLKSQSKCAKCGDTRGYVLDYHHLDPNAKENTIARMTSNYYSLDRVMNEIQKCICLCANCHREFHYLEREQQITIQEYLS